MATLHRRASARASGDVHREADRQRCRDAERVYVVPSRSAHAAREVSEETSPDGSRSMDAPTRGDAMPEALDLAVEAHGDAMPDLLDLAVEAHGGLARWKQVSSIEIAVSITGGIWYVKSQPDVLKDIVMVADTDRQRVVTT